MGNFVAASTVEKNALNTIPVVNIPLSFANGTKSSCNKSVAAASLCFEHHGEKLDFRVAPLTHYDVILGKPWLETWNPTINWRTNTITFKTSTENPNPQKTSASSQTTPETPKGTEDPPPIQVDLISLIELETMATQPDLEMFLAELSP